MSDLSSIISGNPYSRTLIVGDQGTGKTSILFGVAYDSACRGGTPLFICNKHKIENNFPLYMQSRQTSDIRNGNVNGNFTTTSSGSQVKSGRKWSPDVMARIHMLYISSLKELKTLCAGLHLFNPPPSIVLIDDLSNIIDPLCAVQRNDPKFLDVCVTLGAFLRNSMQHVKLPPTVGCASVVTNATAPCEERDSNHQVVRFVVTDECKDTAFVNAMKGIVDNVCVLTKKTLPAAGGETVATVSMTRRWSAVTDAQQQLQQQQVPLLVSPEEVLGMLEIYNGHILY